MEYLDDLGIKAKEAAKTLSRMSAPDKNGVLLSFAEALELNAGYILHENEKDMAQAKANGVRPVMLDRLMLDKKRISSMACGLRDIAEEADPVGEVLYMKKLPNGLTVGQKRVPIGVVGIIYEARPNVTSDAAALCVKAGSSVVLRGGGDALRSNMAIVGVFQEALEKRSLPVHIVQLITDVSRETAAAFMRLNKYIDVLIPRGGGGLIRSVVENSTIPVIETGTGNCHIFVDESADIQKALDIVINAKVQRPGVCNACEKLLVHKNIADNFIPAINCQMTKYGVEVRGDEKTLSLLPDAVPAAEEDWQTEYLDYIIGIRVVNDIDEAIGHISKYSSGHSEAILTESYTNAQRFLDEVDSAAVYVNASTRFTDGGQFGLGAEIGISTQKLHARGPMGVRELTTTKYIIYGNGQIRD